MNRKELEKEQLKKFVCPEEDTFNSSGVLLSDAIEKYVKAYNMIFPFDSKNLKPASYELTVGYEYSIKGENRELSDEVGKNIITVEPFEVVIIRTREIINLPRFIIARWNIRVRKAYEGLLWVGGPQVDPGWVGKLSCPLYNLSHKPVTLKLFEPIAVIDFIKTTAFTKYTSVEYQLEKGKYEIERQLPSRILFEDYEPNKLQSALYNEAKIRIDKIVDDTEKSNTNIKNKLDKLEARLDTSTGIGLGVMAIIITAVTIFVGSGSKDAPSIWYVVSNVIALIALLFSLYAISNKKQK